MKKPPTGGFLGRTKNTLRVFKLRFESIADRCELGKQLFDSRIGGLCINHGYGLYRQYDTKADKVAPEGRRLLRVEARNARTPIEHKPA